MWAHVGGGLHDVRMSPRHPPRERLSQSAARRVALRAQGLAGPRPRQSGPVTMRGLQGVIDRLGLLQIDSVNVLARAHLMPAYSRLGPYDTGLLDRATERSPRRLVEAWAHVASYVPPETYQLLAWRRRAYVGQAWGMIADVPLAHAPVVDDVRALLAERGPLTSAQVHDLLEGVERRKTVEWGWNWSVAKRVLEYLFFTGEVTAAGRTSAFERRYDLADRVLPPAVVAAPHVSDDDAVRALVEIAARAHGIGTSRCLADYFRLRDDHVAPAIDALVDEGVLVPAEVDGWPREVYRHHAVTPPRRATASALLSPFDPLVFERRRLEELFGLRYRIEIYVPAAKRVWGYYVLPFLWGEQIEALVDLKADRAARVLLVQAAHRAPGAEGRSDVDVAVALAAELRLMASWLGLEDVRLGSDGVGGTLMAPVQSALASEGTLAGPVALEVL